MRGRAGADRRAGGVGRRPVVAGRTGLSGNGVGWWG